MTIAMSGMPLAAMGLHDRVRRLYGFEDIGGLVDADGGDITPAALLADLAMRNDVVIGEHELDALEMRMVNARLETVFALGPGHIREGAQGGFEWVFVRHRVAVCSV